MSQRGVDLAAEPLQVARPGPGNHDPGRAGYPVLERADVLEHEVAAPVPDPSDHPLDPDETGRAVMAVDHQLFHGSRTLQVSLVDLGHAGAGEPGCSLDLRVRLLVPALDLEGSACLFLHRLLRRRGNSYLDQTSQLSAHFRERVVREESVVLHLSQKFTRSFESESLMSLPRSDAPLRGYDDAAPRCGALPGAFDIRKRKSSRIHVMFSVGSIGHHPPQGIGQDIAARNASCAKNGQCGASQYGGRQRDRRARALPRLDQARLRSDRRKPGARYRGKEGLCGLAPHVIDDDLEAGRTSFSNK